MLYFLQLILVIGLFLSHSLILTGLLYGSSIALLQLMTPFINSLGMESINQGHSLNFALENGKRIRIPRDSRVRTITVIGMETGPAFTVMIPRM